MVTHDRQPAQVPLRVPGIIADNMVFQQGMPICIWGWARAGVSVTATLDEECGTTVAYDGGKWKLILGPRQARENLTLTVTDGTDTITCANVAVGEVWVCSGQSNMQWSMAQGNGVLDNEREKAAANYHRIRLFQVPNVMSEDPCDDVWSHWDVCTPETVENFSAVGYFFGRALHDGLDTPIGLINSSRGGAPAEAWMDRDSILSNPEFAQIYHATKEVKEVPDKPHSDPGNQGVNQGWHNGDHNDIDWDTMTMPVMWQDEGLDHNGAIWFRQTVNLPKEWAGRDLWCNLGVIDDFDTTYFNGEHIGGLGPDVAEAYRQQRTYRVPGALVREGKNTIAVRIFDQWGKGGMPGPRYAMYLETASEDNTCTIALHGTWKYRVECALPRLNLETTFAATSLFNAMIAPLTPLAIRGVIWYQGESNTRRGRQYRDLLNLMIAGWRRAWNIGNFPFLIVQLANYRETQTEAVDGWALVREAQYQVTRDLPATWCAAAIDVGDPGDIHPRNKQEVGRRLSLTALAKCYGRDIACEGPTLRSAERIGGTMRVKFDNAGGLHARGGEPKSFAVRGKDGRFFPAKARIDSETIVLESDKVSLPVAVEYGWEPSPEINLYNIHGFPALPFRFERG